ncbi:uncharacterized protein LOC133326993 [Musca vetustissima]|uniref:uncharacterized protein LOC133326993 n=1 Tax=Musca vetustissima TaxID=27455 RepID=UPI002AB7D25E|nr:uncharacterized protein LOC133326993 [Musca vetustissima]
MWNGIEVIRLIDEVRIRPVLWDVQRRHSYKIIKKQWKEVAEAVGVDVRQCRRKWGNLRDTYRALLRRCENRIKRDKALGVYNPKIQYAIKWTYYKELSFIKDNTRTRRNRPPIHQDQNINSQHSFNESQSNDIGEPQTTEEPDDYEMFSAGDYREMEGGHYEEYEEFDDNDDDDGNDQISTEQFKNLFIPEDEFRRSISATQKSVPNNITKRTAGENVGTTTTLKAEASTQTATTSNANKKDCNCSAQNENLLKDIHNVLKLMQQQMSTTATNNKDPDYNFLVSFLPQLKQMNDIQNIQFRARMSDLVLDILMPVMPTLTPFPGSQIGATSELHGNCQSNTFENANTDDADNKDNVFAATSTSSRPFS